MGLHPHPHPCCWKAHLVFATCPCGWPIFWLPVSHTSTSAASGETSSAGELCLGRTCRFLWVQATKPSPCCRAGALLSVPPSWALRVHFSTPILYRLLQQLFPSLPALHFPPSYFDLLQVQGVAKAALNRQLGAGHTAAAGRGGSVQVGPPPGATTAAGTFGVSAETGAAPWLRSGTGLKRRRGLGSTKRCTGSFAHTTGTKPLAGAILGLGRDNFGFPSGRAGAAGGLRSAPPPLFPGRCRGSSHRAAAAPPRPPLSVAFSAQEEALGASPGCFPRTWLPG